MTVEDFLQKQTKDAFCKQAAKTAGQLGPQYEHTSYGFLAWKPALNFTVQLVVQNWLGMSALYQVSSSLLASPPGV